MADKNDNSTPARDVDSLVRGLRAAGTESMRLARATAKLEKSFEEASNTAIDKAAEALTELAKQSSILEDTLKAEIAAHKHAPRELAKVMDRLEAQGDALIKEQKRYKEQLKGLQAERKKLAKLDQADANVQKKLRDVTAKELDLKLDLNDRLKELIPNVADAADKLDQLAAEAHKNKETVGKLAQDLQKPSAKFGKALEGMHSKVQTSISGLGEFATVVGLAKKAIGELWGQSIRLANKGLVGSMAQMNISALKLRMTAEEFEGLVSANREMVALMGGGAQGIENFEAILSESSVGLEYLGKEGKKAASTIMAGFNRAGFGLMSTNRDVADAYQQNVRGLTKQFKLFNGVFGDTAEEFANLYEQQLKSESLQAKLLSGDTKGVALQMKEIMARTENLKLMGLNNEQIIAMSKRADALFNPTENRQGEAQTERIAARQAMMLGAQTVQRVDADLAKRLQGYIQSGTTERVQNMSAQDRASFSAQNPQYAKDIALLDQTIANMRQKDGGDTSQIGNAYVHTRKMAGKEYGFEAETGKDLLGAKAKGFDQTPEGMLAIKAKGFENTLSTVEGETTKLGKAFGNLRDAVEGVTGIFNNPFTSALSAAGAALLFSSSTFKGAVLKAAASVMGVGKMMFSSLGGFMKGLGVIAKKIPILGAIFSALEGAYEGYQTDTDEYYKRLGIEQEATVVPQFLKDLGVRTIGVLSDVSRAAVKNFTLGTVDMGKDWKRNSDPVATGNIPSASKLPNAAGGQIAKVLSVSPGSNIVQRPDGTIEKVTGDRNWRNNNPGNIRSNTDFARQHGAIGSDGKFAIFPDYNTGRNAKASLIFDGANYKNLSLTDMVSRYAPAKDGNNVPAYQSAVLAAVNGQNKRMADYTPEERQRILDAMQKIEGFRAGKTTQLSTPQASMMPDVKPQSSTSTAPAPSSQPSAPSASPGSVNTSSAGAAANNGNPVISELQKHTTLLGSLVMLMGKTPASPRGYQMDSERGLNATG